MTYVAQKAGMPAFDKFLMPIVDALKKHNGFARREIVEQEVIDKIRRHYRIESIRPQIDEELRYRVQRSEELLLRAGLLMRQGIDSLKLTSLALLLTREEVVRLPQKIREMQKPVILDQERVGVLTPPTVPLFDDIASFIRNELSGRKLSALEIEERVLKHFARTAFFQLQSGETAANRFDELAPSAPPLYDNYKLDLLRSRTQSARRVLETLAVIAIDSTGVYSLTAYGTRLSDKELRDLAFPALDILAWRKIRKWKKKIDNAAREKTRARIFGRFAKESALFVGAFLLTLFVPQFAKRREERKETVR